MAICLRLVGDLWLARIDMYGITRPNADFESIGSVYTTKYRIYYAIYDQTAAVHMYMFWWHTNHFNK